VYFSLQLLDTTHQNETILEENTRAVRSELLYVPPSFSYPDQPSKSAIYHSKIITEIRQTLFAYHQLNTKIEGFTFAFVKHLLLFVLYCHPRKTKEKTSRHDK